MFPSLRELDARFDATIEGWQGWSGARTVAGSWGEAVSRSALVLKLLVHAPSGAVAAAATTSLPEQVGGSRNWDYRYCWVRDAAFTFDALAAPGLRTGGAGLLLVAAARVAADPPTTAAAVPPRRGSPRHGAVAAPGRLPRLPTGARRATPRAASSSWTPTASCSRPHGCMPRQDNHVDRDVGRRLAEIADLVCELWREPDAGIWEVRSEPEHFTHSKMMCWVALDRASRLAVERLASRRARRPLARAGSVRSSASSRSGASPRTCRATCGSPGTDELDASVLLGLLAGYGEPKSPRWRATIDAVRT